MPKIIYQMSFDFEGDAAIALTGLEGRFLNQGFDFGKARVTCTKMKRLPGPKKQSDSLGLKGMAGMLEDVPPEPKNRWLAREDFASLEAAIRAAVLLKFGKGYYIIDFSPSEVILAQAAAVESQYWKVSYKVTNGAVDFEGALTSVKRTIDYI